MNNEELKKEIIDILDSLQTHGVRLENIAETGPIKIAQIYTPNDKIADALIAAGLKFDVNYSFTAAFNSVQAERERDLEHRLTAAEHRAEVAERALKRKAHYFANCSDYSFLKNEREKERYEKAIFEDWINQAEKELAEEGKDG